MPTLMARAKALDMALELMELPRFVLWLLLALRGSRVENHPTLEQIEACSSVALVLGQLEPIDLALGVITALWLGQCSPDGRVALQSRCECRDRGGAAGDQLFHGPGQAIELPDHERRERVFAQVAVAERRFLGAGELFLSVVRLLRLHWRERLRLVS